MAEPSSWIRLNRNIISWRHWKNHKISCVFIWLMIKAQYGDESYVNNTRICRGEVVTSIGQIGEENGLSYQQVRDILKVLKNTGEITTKKGQHFIIINIVNYEKYQPIEGYAEQTDNKLGTNREQTDNNLKPNRKQHYKNYKKDIREEGKEYGSAPLQNFPCGVAVKPEWMAEELWNDVKFRTVDEIPVKEQGDYDTYIEYAEECHKQGRDIR